MDVISRVAGSTANLPIARSNREQSEELRKSYGREVDSGVNRDTAEAAQGIHGVQGVQGQINTENNVSTMFSYLNNGTDVYGAGAPENSLSWGSGLFDDGGTAEATAASAAANIEARTEALATEIAFDRARGHDVTESLEAMVNLSENQGILNENTEGMSMRPPAGASFAPSFATEPPVNLFEVADELEVDGVTAVIAEPVEQPGFAVAGAFEGSVSEQIVQAAAEPEEGELSIAAQIAAGAKAEHADAANVMSGEVREVAEVPAK